MLDITKVPFNQLLGIMKAHDENYLLQLNARDEYTNHLGTVHAAALFALAEGSGAEFMIRNFPRDLIEQVIPVLRKAEVTYKKPAKGVIVSNAKLKDAIIEEVVLNLETKKRVSLNTVVELFDESNVKVFSADFGWFVVFK
jgi:hypothetical protein